MTFQVANSKAHSVTHTQLGMRGETHVLTFNYWNDTLCWICVVRLAIHATPTVGAHRDSIRTQTRLECAANYRSTYKACET